MTDSDTRDDTADTALPSTVWVIGGRDDPNLGALLRTLADLAIPHRSLRVGADAHPALTWELGDDRLWIDGAEVRPAAVFLRYDVFSHLGDPRPATAFRATAWHTTIVGWLAAHPEVRYLNRGALLRYTHKLHALALARAAGLAIPETRVTNELAALVAGDGGPWVAKPVAGGGYCRRLRELVPRTPVVDGIAAAPAIVQPELVAPELRIYGISRGISRGIGRPSDQSTQSTPRPPRDFFAFEVVAETLDYRRDPAARIEPRPVPPDLAAGVDAVMDGLGLDFAAADFKGDPQGGRPRFLEINSGPMFAAFDRASGGALSQSLARALADLNAT